MERTLHPEPAAAEHGRAWYQHRASSEQARVWTTELRDRAGERVRLSGWLHRFRRLGAVAFLVLRDGRGTAQVVVEDAALADRLAALNAESVLAVEGVATLEPQAPGGVEVRQPTVDVLSAAAAPPPLELHRPALNATLPTILDHAPVALRHPRQRALFRLSSAAMHGFRSTLRGRGFAEIQTPKIVAAATESGANVYRLDYHGRPAYLSQSPQLYKQVMVGVFERVFEVGPAFRAEPHDTARHLNEFVSLDAEMGFVDDHTTVMAVLAETVRGMVEAVAEEVDATRLLGLDLPEVPLEVPRVHFADAMAMIGQATDQDLSAEPDLAPAHERWLGEWAKQNFGSDFLFVVGYPMVKRPFYTHPEPGRPLYSNSFDLLFRGLELVTGGQRLHRADDYDRALAARGLDPAPLEWYLEAFRHGMPPHGGFAIGLERFVARLTGAQNVRETTLFPRDLQRLTP
jgi:nondiscriminating aspartyl-tRNA synthetase